MGYDSRVYYRPSGFGGFTFFPPVIKNLLIINALVFLLQVIGENILIGSGFTLSDILTKFFSLIPLGGLQVGRIGPEIIEWSFYPWQLVSYQFMHGSFTHILFNMFMLWMFGMEIEHIMGSKKFLLFYLLCGVGAGLLQILLSPALSDSLAPTIGASGAVYGVMIAFAMFFPDRYVFIYFLIPIKAKYLIAILVVFEFLSVNEPSVVAHLAHIGGAITGFIFLLLDKRNNFSFSNVMNSFKKSSSFNTQNKFRKPRFGSSADSDIEDAKFHDIRDSAKDEIIVTQEEIDRILDKISQSGYQNLTEREKKILFEASKRK